MIENIKLKTKSEAKSLYFASDFHLGTPNAEASLEREKEVIKWLDFVKNDAAAIFLVGDIFDFWFEYKHVVPKGFTRFLGKIAELTDQGIPVYFFTGNHDVWMFDYFEKELNVTIYRHPISFEYQGKKILLGHGDGLGPGDTAFKFIKSIFTNKVCQRLFKIIHPYFGVGFAHKWSKHSRASHGENDEKFLGEKEFLWQYCKETQQNNPHNYYIFGHRHLVLNLKVDENATYFNLGEWFSQKHYGVITNGTFELKQWKS